MFCLKLNAKVVKILPNEHLLTLMYFNCRIPAVLQNLQSPLSVEPRVILEKNAKEPNLATKAGVDENSSDVLLHRS